MQNVEQLHAHDSYQNVTEPQATVHHTKHTHVKTQELWVRPTCSYKHAAHRLVQHTLQVMFMWRWHGQMKVLPYRICKSSNDDKWYWQTAMQLLLSSSHWIHVGRSMTGLCSCYHHRRGRLAMVCAFNYSVLESFMNHTHTHTRAHTHTHTHSCVSDYQPGSASPYSRWYSHSININITLDYPAASTISAKEHWHAIFV